MDLNKIALDISQILWGWPLIIIFSAVGILTTIALNFIQFRYFFTSWKLVLFAENEKSVGAEITPFEAFINALGSSVGNGSIAGIATGIYLGGPGSAFWLLLAGIFCLSMRFAEIYLATSIVDKVTGLGGPMVYLKKIPGGYFLTYLFTIFTLLFGLIIGNAMQANSIALGVYRTWGINKYFTSLALLLFITYVMIGGARRIISISDKLVPFKVAVFLLSSIIILIYHYHSILPALKLIFASALMPQAVGGAVAGFAIQQAISNGISRLINANEAGLGTAGILFGASRSKNPIKDSIMSMVTVFISTYLICFMVALLIVATGVWNNGQTSTALTISAFETVFCQYGGWIVTFISVSFGLGVIVPYAFITRETWLFLTKGRFAAVFYVAYCLITPWGALASVDLIWNATNIINGVMLLINLYAIVYLLPYIRANVISYSKNSE